MNGFEERIFGSKVREVLRKEEEVVGICLSGFGVRCVGVF